MIMAYGKYIAALALIGYGGWAVGATLDFEEFVPSPTGSPCCAILNTQGYRITDDVRRRTVSIQKVIGPRPPYYKGTVSHELSIDRRYSTDSPVHAGSISAGVNNFFTLRQGDLE
jgi:hypothetical protein